MQKACPKLLEKMVKWASDLLAKKIRGTDLQNIFLKMIDLLTFNLTKS